MDERRQTTKLCIERYLFLVISPCNSNLKLILLLRTHNIQVIISNNNIIQVKINHISVRDTIMLRNISECYKKNIKELC